MAIDTEKDGWAKLGVIADRSDVRYFPSDNLRNLRAKRLSAAREFLNREFGETPAKVAVANLFTQATEVVSLLSKEEARKLAMDLNFHLWTLAKEKP